MGAVFVFLATFTVAVQGGTRYRRDTNDDLNKAIGQAEDDINNFFAKIYGGKCAVANQFTGDQCLSPIATCDTNQGIAGLGGSLVWLLFSSSEGSCAAASAAAAPQSWTASAAAAGGTRATHLLELAKPSFPPSRLSGTHLNIGKIFGTSSRIYRPSREIYSRENFFTANMKVVYKIQYLHTTR